MTTNLAPADARAVPSAARPDPPTLAAEHAQLTQGVHRRMWPVLALIDAGTWPTAELVTLVGYLRSSLMRQASDEEAFLFRGGSGTPFAELTAQHARLHELTERLAESNATHCRLPQLRRMVAELGNALAEHLKAEQAVLCRMAAPDCSVPSANGVAYGRAWLPADDAPLRIVLDDLAGGRAAQLCIERLLRLHPGQRAEVRSAHRSDLMQVYRWLREFDPGGYGTEYAESAEPADAHLEIIRRRAD